MPAMLRLALPVLAAASSALAASTCSPPKGSETATIQNSGDIASASGCKTFSGSIAIATQAAGDISLDGIGNIDGDLISDGAANVSTISGNELESIKGFNLNQLTSLKTISFPKLKTITTIKWVSVPKLDTVDAPIEEAQDIDIENSNLQEFPAFKLDTINSLTVVNNAFINKINLALKNITGLMIVQGNKGALDISLPNLESAANITILNSGAFSAPSLTTLSDSLNLRENGFESFTTPNLTKVGNALALSNNNQLTNISFPQLTEVTGGFIIANNTLLSKINNLPKLKTIKANLDFHGNFSEVSLPSLNEVDGSFNIQSTGDVQKTCDDVFAPMAKDHQKIRGEYKCKGQVVNPGAIDSTPTPISGADGPKPTGAASSVHVQQGVLGMAGVAAVVAFFL